MNIKGLFIYILIILNLIILPQAIFATQDNDSSTVSASITGSWTRNYGWGCSSGPNADYQADYEINYDVPANSFTLIHHRDENDLRIYKIDLSKNSHQVSDNNIDILQRDKYIARRFIRGLRLENIEINNSRLTADLIYELGMQGLFSSFTAEVKSSVELVARKGADGKDLVDFWSERNITIVDIKFEVLGRTIMDDDKLKLAQVILGTVLDLGLSARQPVWKLYTRTEQC